MPLTDSAYRNATCPPDKPYVRLRDGGSLYLEVKKTGAKTWYWKYYKMAGEKLVESRMTLGQYPEIGAKAARAARTAARATHQSGTDPIQKKRADRLAAVASGAVTFDAIAAEFLDQRRSGWSDTYSEKWRRLVERALSPYIGELPLASITAPMLLDALRRTEKRGTIDTLHCLRQYAGQVFSYGIATGRCERNVAADLKGALPPKVVRHMGAQLDPVGVGHQLRAIDDYSGAPETRVAATLSALLFQRPGNIRFMRWEDIDVQNAMWTIPSAEMKGTKTAKINGRPHRVPLAPQALALIEEMRPLNGRGRYVFPSKLTGERPMSENTIRNALRRMGYSNEEATAHGFRATAKTLLLEKLPGVNPDVILAQMSHGKNSPLGMAYDRAEYMDQRRQMMVLWADYLDKLRAGAEVIPFAAGSA
jgi:integrase